MTDADGQVHDIDYSLDGQSMLVISGTLYPKIFNKEGEDESVPRLKKPLISYWCYRKEFVKGDVYLRDMKNTKYVFQM
jgi:hypothetical protein